MPRILLIEDDSDVRDLFEHTLIDAGYEVDATPTLHGGEQLLRSREYDLVVADGILPDGTGTDLAKMAKAKSIPMLVVTGYGFSLSLEAPELEGCTVVPKPIRSRELIEAVANALRSTPS
jgi:DNA-binding response OmpR family regulator